IVVNNQLAVVDQEWQGYPGYLTQIILNLLTNIERYAYPNKEGGKVEIILSTQNEKQEFNLIVRDFGCGIAEADQPKLFEAFFTTGRSKGGTGLGLAIVHTLVMAMKGKIEINSQLGQGTTVKLIVPRNVPELNLSPTNR